MLTGIFSGSFNPIHIGHLALANWICEYGKVDEIWFVVSPQNPFKKNDELMDENLRFEMVKKAIKGYKKFKASDFEFSLPRPSYTVNTLRALRKKYPKREFALIIGADSWQSFQNWKEADAIISEFRLIIYPRKGFDINIPETLTNVKKVEAPLFEISSTFVRDSLRNGKDVRFFLPEAIRNVNSEFLIRNS